MNRLKLFIPLFVFIILCGFLFAGLGKDPSHLPSVLIGKPFPEFSAPKLKNATEIVSKKDLPNEPFLLNLWATWCTVCIQEHPFLKKLAEQGIPIVGVSYKDENDKALQWLNRLGDPYLFNIVDTDGRLGLSLGVYGAPETYIVDKNGVIQYRHAGDVNERVWSGKMAPIFNSL